MRLPKLSTMICILLTAFVCTPQAHAGGFLRTRGQDVVDAEGQKVLLRGVGLGNWLLPEGYMWQFGNRADRPRRIEKLVSELIGEKNAARFWSEYRRNYITESDVQRISELGFNSVRAVLNARLLLSEGDSPAYVDEGFELLDNLVRSCAAHHVYVIIDMHAAPGGQTGQNIDDSRDDQPELFTDQKNQDRLVDLWVKIASRYKDQPAVAAYDLLNEPLPRRTGAEGRYKDQLEPLYQRITAAIRAVDSKHIITLEGADWANDWSIFSRPFDSNLLYQFHYYCWDRPDKVKDIGRYLDYRQKLNAPVWVGETGEKNDRIYWATTDYLESNNIGWSFWPWKKIPAANCPYSIKPPEGWAAIRAYSRGGDKPSADVAQRAFDQLLDNIRLERCHYRADVVSALFRRAPCRIEAENYSHQGLNHSYGVRPGTPKSKLYRTSEPVLIELADPGDARAPSDMFIKLTGQEWTAYTVNSPTARDYDLVVKVRSQAPGALVQISVNEQSQEFRPEPAGWAPMKLKPVKLAAGSNVVKLLARSGTVDVDWFEFQ